MARGQGRLLGSSCKITFALGGDPPITLMEVDKFSAKANDDVKESRPLGTTKMQYQVDHKGFDLSFSGGKVNPKAANLLQAQTEHILDKSDGMQGLSPELTVIQTLRYAGGRTEQYRYEGVTLYGYNFDAGGSGEEITESFEGKAVSRIRQGDDPGVSADVPNFKSIIEKMLHGQTTITHVEANGSTSQITGNDGTRN